MKNVPGANVIIAHPFLARNLIKANGITAKLLLILPVSD